MFYPSQSGATTSAQISKTQGVEKESSKLKIFNTEANKHLLIQGINTLSTRVQKDNVLNESNSNNSARMSDFVLLKLENEALDHIENLILDVFDSILLAASNLNETSPELTCALIMSDSSSNQNSTFKTLIYPISNLTEAELRVKQALPKVYSYEACSKALLVVEKCRTILSNSKKSRFLKTFNNNSSSLSILCSITQASSSSSSSSPNENSSNSSFTFSFPLDRIHSILSELYQSPKIDVYVTIFLVAILEYITKDILRLSTSYSRYLNKYSISKRDISTSLQADYKLTKLFYPSSNNNSNNLNYLNNDSLFDDFDITEMTEELDEDFRAYQIDFELGRFTVERGGHDFLVKPASNRPLGYIDSASIVSLPNLVNPNDSTISPSNTEECTSDSSTICPDSITYENLNLKYYLKVKELILEQQQHLSDLNILRRIFMYLFQKHGTENLIENIFGNINDVYECALRLSDLLDEALSNQQQLKQEQETNPQQTYQPLMVGQQFWELAEGAEFDVYLKYALNVNNYELVKSSLHSLLNDQNLYKTLQNTSQGLVEISKYLLPKLLLGSVHHFLYLFETINSLLQMSFDEEDKIFLNDTLDTLKSTKFNLNNLGFSTSKKRPIETSFRIFQPHQFQQLGASNKTNSMNSSSCSIGQASNISTLTNTKSPALAYNIGILTERKWKELDLAIDSLKLPSHIYSGCQPQILVGNQTKSVGASIMSGSNIRYAYLYEGNLQICKTTQSIQCTQGNSLKSTLLSQSKLKISKRYVYLFDGLLIFVKKQQANMLLNANLNSNLKPYRFKEVIQLDKCCIRDREDEVCFELQIMSQFYSDSDSSMSNQSQSDVSQDQEFILFVADSSNEKYQWMSMLCYSQYKLTIDRLLQQMTEEHNKNNPLPIPPKGYIFDQPDSSDTILFEQPSKCSDQPETRNPYSNSDGLAIKAATLIKLVERLTHHFYMHPKFSPTFLMFFREFSSPKELLSLLSIRYDVPDLDLDEVKHRYNFTSGGITERELLKRYRREYQQPIRLKVINLIKHWIEGYYNDDFANNPDILSDLKVLIEKVGIKNKRFEQVLIKTLQKKQNMYQEQLALKQHQNQHQTNNELTFISKIDEPHIDYNNLKNIFKKKFSTSLSSNSSLSNHSASSRSSSSSTNEDILNENQQDLTDFLYPPFETHLEHLYPYELLTIHPLEFARQATLMEEELFKAIKPNELISLGWNKPDQKYKLSPNVSKLINLSNKFTYWYAKCIVDTLNIEERVAVVQRLLDIAQYFYQMNNFSGLKEIYAAFETSSTARLTTTRERSGLEQHKMYAKFKQLFDNHDKGYLDRLKKCSPPCIPFIGIHLTIIYRTHEYNKLNIENQKLHILQQQQKFSTNKSSESSEQQQNQSNDESSPSEQTEQSNNLINFSKYRLLVEFVNDLLQYQTVSYKFRVNEKIRSFLLEDIENYFEKAQHALETSDEFKNSEAKTVDGLTPLSPAQIVESWLFEKSRQIEPFDEKKFPKLRNYSLKPPPVSNRANAKNFNTNKLGDSPRSHSATRIVEKKSNQVKQNQQLAPPVLKTSSSSIGKMSSLNKPAKTINNSKTSYNISNPKEESVLHKRSNSSNNTQFNDSSHSPTLVFSTNPSQAADISSHNSKKLSVSSADSSSSAPNSPPPNYDEVFDLATVGSVFPLITNQTQEKCFDNRTYYQRTSTSSTGSAVAKPVQQQLTENSFTSNSSIGGVSASSSTSSISQHQQLRNQINVFSFPDFNEIDESHLSQSLDQISPILPFQRVNSIRPPLMPPPPVPPQAPGHPPPSPPSQPPPINRQNKPTAVQKKSPQLPTPPSAPPPIPNRPARNKPSP